MNDPAVIYDKESRQLEVNADFPFWVNHMLQDSSMNRLWWITKGLGAGGTYGLAIWHIALCHININSNASWCLGPSFSQVSTTLLPIFIEVFARHFNMHEGVDYQIRRGSPYPQIMLWWGHHIDFFSANAPDRMVGPSISHCSGTEVGLWKQLAFQKSRSRCRCPKAARIQYLGEGTPEGFNWWEQEANFEEGGRHADPAKKRYRRIRLETEDNPHLPPGYVTENLEPTYGGDLNRLLSYTKGIFTAFQKGTAYWDFHSKAMLLDVKVSKPSPIALCWDFNKVPSWALIQRQVFYKRGNRFTRWVTLDESSGKSKGLARALAEFIAKYDPAEWYETPIYVYGDASGWADSHKVDHCDYDVIKSTLRKYYREVHVRAQRSNPSIRTRLEHHNNLFSYELYAVAAWCVNTIRSYTETCLTDGWDIKKPDGDDWSHFGDANGYGLFEMTKSLDFELPERERTRGLNKRV